MGGHNINLVSPGHVVAQLIAAVAIAAEKGLRLPLVYNTGGYDSPEALWLLDGILDIYMPALILIVVLAIVTARPKHGGPNGKDDEPEK